MVIDRKPRFPLGAQDDDPIAVHSVAQVIKKVIEPGILGRLVEDVVELTVEPYELLRVHMLKTRFFPGDDLLKRRKLVLLDSPGCEETRVPLKNSSSAEHLIHFVFGHPFDRKTSIREPVDEPLLLEFL